MNERARPVWTGSASLGTQAAGFKGRSGSAVALGSLEEWNHQVLHHVEPLQQAFHALSVSSGPGKR
ncbi:MAG: hypothetical protein ACO218_07160, partial [Steroidobacteraceae bacterium]